MLQDDDYEELLVTPERLQLLGFKPQKEVLTNHVLPYASELDEESLRFLDQVKTNLSKAVMLREVKPACGVWSSRLMKYIRIYGLKFSKEDHIALIKLSFELVHIPDLEPCKIHKFATLFVMLTKKRHLISPEELTLPWRPLYDLGNNIFDKSATHIGMYHYLTSMEASYVTMVKCAKPYFAVSATREILEEILPQVQPWSSDTHVMAQLAIYLPVALHPRHAAHGHQLWFDDLMRLSDTCYNSQCCVSDLIMVSSGLAKRNPGAVDWTPYVPKMFSRFLHALNLPVSYKEMQCSKSHSIDTKHMSTWIVWNINPNGVVLMHLRSFIAAIESYLHSANSGRWSYKLRDLLRKLAREFLNRVRREREKRFKNTWENQPDESFKLRDEDITEFVNILLEPTLQAVYNRTGSLDVSIALQNLATLRPAIVVPPLIEKLKTALTSLTEPHRVTAAMTAVASVARPMLRGADLDYPEGPTHVVPLLLSVLPGLDPNDIKKTLVTLHFILIFSWMVPYIDCSSAPEYWNDLTEEELLACESTAQFEDFVLVFLDKVFTIIDSCVTEHARLDTKDSDWIKSKTDAVLETAICSAATSVLMQCSPKIFKEALRKFKAFATESTFETHVSGSMVGVLLRVFARVNSELTLAAFLPKLCDEVVEILSTDEILHDENPPRDLTYRLVLLLNCVESDGTVLLKYMPNLLPVLDRALKIHTTYALQRACDVLSHILTSLCYIDLKDWRSVPKDYNEAPEKWLPVREWGKGCFWKDVNFDWHVPNADEAACAQMLIDRYLKPEVNRLDQWLKGEREISKERRLRCFHVMNSILSGYTFMPQPNESPIFLNDSQVPAISMPLTNGVKYEVKLDGVNIRVALTKLMCEVQSRMLADRTDDTKGLEMLIQVWERIIILKGLRSGSSIEARLRSFMALERTMDGRGGVGGESHGSARLRMLLADAARLQDESRLDLVCEAGITPSALQALHCLFDLSIHTYSSVRLLAQVRLYWMLSHYPYSYRILVPKLVDLLGRIGEGEEWHARHKGALYVMLGPRTGPLLAKQDWAVASTLWPAVLRAALSEKLSILKLEQAFGEMLHRHFPTVNTKLTVTDSAISCAKVLLRDDQMSDPAFTDILSKAPEWEAANNVRTERLYLNLVDKLIDIAETPNIQWRRLELTMQMLTSCPSLQTPYPPRAVRLMVKSLVHDDITVRRIAQKLTYFALRQRKRPLKKIMVDPYEVAGVPKPEKRIPGYRKDLEWAIYSEDRTPKTDEEWDRPWLRNPVYGFYSWPDKIKVAAPSAEQRFSSDFKPEEMEEGERYLYEFFSDEANVDRLVAFYTVEEKKGKDKFNGTRFSMFRVVFSQFGEEISDKFMSHALRCAADTQEACQRFAAEIAAAAVRAPRDWGRERATRMYEYAMKIITAGLTSVTPETMEDWGTCIASSAVKLDPHRAGPLLRDIVSLCAPAQGTDDAHTASFTLAARLYALQGILGSMSWRVAPLAKQLLLRLDGAGFIHHPYQNVRETVGSLLMGIFDTELQFPGGETPPSPCLLDFVDDVKQRLAALYDENGDIVIKTGVSISSADYISREQPSLPAESDMTRSGSLPGQLAVEVARLSDEGNDGVVATGSKDAVSVADPEGVNRSLVGKQLAEQLHSALQLSGDASPTPKEYAKAVTLLTTVLRALMGTCMRGLVPNTRAHYSLAGLACAVAARGPPMPHEELPRAADGFLASLSLAAHDEATLALPLETIERLSTDRSWWARLSCLEFAQPLLFYALPLLRASPDRAASAEHFALRLMKDTRLEVRQSAAKLLTGLMHCRALPDEDKTLKILTRNCRSKELVERHCGVLGLCAYLSSRPYSLGPKLGHVLAELSKHTSAPDPIPATIRTALADFRRTHHDDWPKHREELTEEELDLLADLTSPPSYCA